jgi:hypothetical protein
MNSRPTPTYDDTPRPARRVVASYADYRDAEKAVDYLAGNRFPVEHVAIVGRELELVQQVTGRLTALDAAARGALTGAVTGLLIGWLFAIFTWFDPRIASGWLIIDGLWFGTLVGIVMGLFMYLVTKSRRRFDAVSRMQPEYFDIAVDELYADDAARMLLGFPLPSRVKVEPPSTVEESAVRPPRPTPAT